MVCGLYKFVVVNWSRNGNELQFGVMKWEHVFILRLNSKIRAAIPRHPNQQHVTIEKQINLVNISSNESTNFMPE